MYTKCPECNSVFRITEELLEIADGLVRCGLCDAVFDGKENLHEESEQQYSPDHDTSTDLQEPVEKIDEEDLYVTEDYSNEDHRDDDKTLIESEKVPSAIREDFGGGVLSKPANPLHAALWTGGAIALALVFLGQITYWQDTDVLPRTWVNNFCSVVGCKSDIERDLNAIKILNRNIFTHPNVKNALMITSSFVNASENMQPFPLLQIALLNTQGEIVAIRRFSPEDYLVNKNLLTTTMKSNEPVGVRLEVFDPGSDVIAYEIEFY